MHSRSLALLAWIAFLAACSTDDSGGGVGYAGSGAGGGTGSTSGGSQCDETCVDSAVAYAIDSLGHLLYNQNIAGQTSPYDKTGPCPGGGTAHVTGTTSTADNEITSVDLTFELTDCKVSAETYVLTIQGPLEMYGTYKTDNYNALTFSSPSISVNGTVLILDQPAVVFTCPMSLADTYQYQSGQKGWLNGSICDRPVSL